MMRQRSEDEFVPQHIDSVLELLGFAAERLSQQHNSPMTEETVPVEPSSVSLAPVGAPLERRVGVPFQRDKQPVEVEVVHACC